MPELHRALPATIATSAATVALNITASMWAFSDASLIYGYAIAGLAVVTLGMFLWTQGQFQTPHRPTRQNLRAVGPSVAILVALLLFSPALGVLLDGLEHQLMAAILCGTGVGAIVWSALLWSQYRALAR